MIAILFAAKHVPPETVIAEATPWFIAGMVMVAVIIVHSIIYVARK